ncbi:MAG: UDP-N-acetylmuramoyl-L-alanyl-D-glutamate--2,6-diaminopimelate ligase [Solirubrobacteraceae bacterium]|nr:UDP-N-acetylmuramoyl-L-alanyl-D-glutamate--2,6-diaminopimelate ligase [Solirubrobacteraceae bacterium]
MMGRGPAGVEVSSLVYDSRQARPGTLFFCVPGFQRDGHDFAADAVQRGAVALVVERPLELGVPEVVVPSVREAMAPAAARFHGDPTSRLRVVGVTGTNGKTTTAWLVRHLLEATGTRTGLLGTVVSVVGGREEPVQRTTPEALDLQATFAEMETAGDRACAMEVSSHALDLHRVDAVHWAAAVYTNLSRDHLDFHGSMEDYFAAKRRLFEASPGAAVVNVDDDHGRRLAGELPGAIGYGVERDAQWRAVDVRSGLTGSSFKVHSPAGELEVRSPLPGRFNVLNSLAALATVAALGVDPHAAASALADFDAVPGRFQPIDEGQEFAVLVDYAHTPDSLENVLSAARELTSGRVIVVFGAGGDRDRGKRPMMGRIAARLADLAVVTSDNPRSEDPQAIIGEIVEGSGPGVEVVADRREAIARAIEAAQPGDVVVVAGKGHEQGQEFENGRKEPFDDVAVAREALHGLATVSP